MAQDKIVTWVKGKKGIHYRPHRQNPQKFVVVKIYHNIKGSKKMLEKFLAGIGGTFTIKKGKYKWVAIAPRKKVETAARETGQQQQQQQQKAKKYTLDTEKEKEKVYQTVGGGTTTVGGGGGGGISWSGGGKYTLAHREVLGPLLDALVESMGKKKVDDSPKAWWDKVKWKVKVVSDPENSKRVLLKYPGRGASSEMDLGVILKRIGAPKNTKVTRGGKHVMASVPKRFAQKLKED